jgi:nitrite reductase/ring-hydroxylating ferredoxin subunit
MKRREFLVASAGCACLIFAPNGRAETAATGPVSIGDLKSFTKEGLDAQFLKKGFFLVRGKDRLYALSAFCTHKTDAQLKGATGAEKIICPRHNAQFALDGTVQRGPAKRNLDRLAITVDAKGQVTVDTSKKIAADKLDEAPAFVKIG